MRTRHQLALHVHAMACAGSRRAGGQCRDRADRNRERVFRRRLGHHELLEGRNEDLAPNGAAQGIKDGARNASHRHARVDQEFAVFLVFLGEPSGKATAIGDNVERELAIGFQGGRSHDPFGFHPAVRKPVCLQISRCHAQRRRHPGTTRDGRASHHEQSSRTGDKGVTFEIDRLSGCDERPNGGKVGHYSASLVLEEATGILEPCIGDRGPEADRVARTGVGRRELSDLPDGRQGGLLCPLEPAGAGAGCGEKTANQQKPHGSLAYLPQRRRKADKRSRRHRYPYLLSSGVAERMRGGAARERGTTRLQGAL